MNRLPIAKQAQVVSALVAMLHRVSGYTEAPDSRSSSATCIGCDMKTSWAVPEHIVCGASESGHADVFAPLHAGNEPFQQKDRNHGHVRHSTLCIYNFYRVHKTPRKPLLWRPGSQTMSGLWKSLSYGCCP